MVLMNDAFSEDNPMLFQKGVPPERYMKALIFQGLHILNAAHDICSLCYMIDMDRTIKFKEGFPLRLNNDVFSRFPPGR